MKQQELNLDSEVFILLRAEMSRAIAETVKEMRLKLMPEGSVTAKIKIGMMNSVDENGEIHNTVIFEPKVTAKVGRSTEEKCGAGGGRIEIGNDGQVLIGQAQVSMDEMMDDRKGA